MIQQWFGKHQNVAVIPRPWITVHSIPQLLHKFILWIGPRQIWNRLYIQSQYLSKVPDIFLFVASLLLYCTIYCGFLQCITLQDRGDLSPIQTLPTGAELLRTMLEWQIDFATSSLQGFLHMDTLWMYISRHFFFYCWHSLLVLQINLLIFHHMLWW